MQKKRLGTSVVILALAAVAAQVQAVGLGSGPQSTVLGQALNHAIGLRLDAGETLAAECVEAEVQSGDRRLPSGLVQARIEDQGGRLVVRVTTTVAIDEPVVSVGVTVGCTNRVTRRFVLFADPPALPAAPAPTPVAVVERQALAAAPAPVPPPAEPVVRPPAAAPSRPAAARTTPAPSEPPAAKRSDARAERPVQRKPPRPRPKAEAPARAAQPASPRLRLDAVEPVPSPPRVTAEMIEAAASAAAAQAAARAAAEATSAAAARIAALERAIERLRADSAADREALRVLRQRAADNGMAARWLPVLIGLLAAMAVLAAWLAIKVRQLQVERQQAWWNAAAASEAEAAAERDSREGPHAVRTAADRQTTLQTASRPGALGSVFAPAPPPAPEPPPSVVERTQAMPVGWREEFEGSRDVSIEELIDLEQQAEFFLVLGQDEAAIDLLVDHLRNTGGGSPLPYLKLLEIYRRRDDREAYERTRARFNHRFNAYAPDWDANAHEGRSLEDYPSIVARLQMAWQSPIDAMAELESLLFRKARGELFDMPAYRDVLFLYALARDLLDRQPMGGGGNVDVLLPISERGEATEPMSLEDAPDRGDSAMVQLDNQPTVPVDLDVTQPVVPESLFGEPVERPRGNRRRP